MKVAIVGAGITGLYLSWKLAEKGEDVTVFEMKKAIGKLACSGLFSDRVLDFIPESQNLIQNQIVAAKIHFPKRTVEVRFSKKFYVMSHFELDNLVANLAKRAGAKIIPNHNVLISDIDGFSKEFDKIIGCDGPNSVVRKSLGLPDPNYRLAIQGFILGQDYSNFVETWPIENGFIWKIPRGKETEYGIIGNPKKIKEIFDEFLDKNKIHLERVSSAIIPQGLIVSDNPKMTLCGDACGLTKPWSGGGVVW